jgi:hypothetical protein
MHATLLLSLLLCSPAVGSPGVQVLRLPGPAEQQLLLGEWTINITYAPSKTLPKGGHATGREIWRAGPDGLSIYEEYHERGDAGVVEGLGLSWYDEAAGGQRFVWCESRNPSGCSISTSVARWDGTALIYSEVVDQAGNRVRREEIFRDITANSFLQLLREGPADGPVRTMVTIEAKKRLPTTPRPVR